MLDRVFDLSGRKTDARTELAAGLTTFLTMAYIIFVQPQVLASAGMDPGAVFTATCISSALGCILMGLWANYPIAQAPLMGENFFFAYVVVSGMGVAWPKALALVFVSGCVFLALTLTRLREILINSVPQALKFGIASGIGLFVALIGLKEAGVVVANAPTLVALGPVTSKPVLLALFGLAVTAGLMARKTRGAILIGMLATSALGAALGLIRLTGVFSAPPSLAPTLFRLDLGGLLTWNNFSIVLIFLFMTLFDTLGTLVGVGVQAGLMKDGKLPRASRALLCDAVATTAGACLGTSTVSSYIESATGVAQGGRTGLTAVTTGLLFLLSLFFSPLVQSIGGSVALGSGALIHPVTAPALILVGSLMAATARHIDWDDATEGLPAFLTMAVIPFTFNIADGIAAGFISYPLLKFCAGRGKQTPPLLWALAVLFLLRYACL
ncbi:MAG TPA: guanine permease [Elusimicrobia bacterium]|nr:guanine permease [Elusimicrobiota bacterium]HBT61464.1 guanine permease [Elusimicrobiota bacterium]